jgi:transposase
MTQVIIGVDPHKQSATIEVLDEGEGVQALGPVPHRLRRVRADAGRRSTLAAAGVGVEGCNGIGRPLLTPLWPAGHPNRRPSHGF